MVNWIGSVQHSIPSTVLYSTVPTWPVKERFCGDTTFSIFYWIRSSQGGNASSFGPITKLKRPLIPLDYCMAPLSFSFFFPSPIAKKIKSDPRLVTCLYSVLTYLLLSFITSLYPSPKPSRIHTPSTSFCRRLVNNYNPTKLILTLDVIIKEPPHSQQRLPGRDLVPPCLFHPWFL